MRALVASFDTTKRLGLTLLGGLLAAGLLLVSARADAAQTVAGSRLPGDPSCHPATYR
ncbi:hypothetical protein [Streptomyces sp. NPDC006879]|uniref:hypothetical protein n=1 Tax=Streptomyces sp. NPDC006879 TaxID=3364767 RepID=UPI0036A31823